MLRRSIIAIALFIAVPSLALAQTSPPVCIPQFVDGASGQVRWQTTLMIHNQDMTQAQIQLHFYRSDGQPLQMMVNERERQRRRIETGPDGQATTNLGAHTAVSLRSMGQGPLQTGSCLIDSAARIEVHSMIHFYDAQGNLLQETAVISQPQFRAADVPIDQTDSAAVGIAVANPADQSVVATFEFIAEDGTTVLGSFQVTLGPHAQIARFVREMFPGFPDDIGSVRITTSSPVCGMVLRLTGLDLMQVPVFINQ
jgi:hypothetical protein